MAVADLGNGETDPVALVESFGDGTSACVVVGTEERCSDVDLVALEAFGDGAAASVELNGPAVVLDESDGSLFVVARNDVTTALRLPAGSLVGELARGVLDPGAVTIALFFESGLVTASAQSVDKPLAWLDALTR
jgi:hypothetical protein